MSDEILTVHEALLDVADKTVYPMAQRVGASPWVAPNPA
jgi:hypothetical protein